MKKLLIGYDGSPGADALLDDLTRAGLPASLDVVVLSVADVWLPTNPPPGLAEVPSPAPESARQSREQASHAVEEHRALAVRGAELLRAQYPGWNVQPESCGDSPAWALIKKADSWRADLVAIGSHGRKVLERFFLGSVSHKVAAEAHCSARIARSRRHTDSNRLRVAVAVDGSPDSARTVEAVAARAWPKFAEFHVIAVLDQRFESALTWPGLFAQAWTPPQDTGARDAVARILEQAAKKLDAAGLTVETHLLNGEPRHELLHHTDAWEADAIFLGARGLHHGGRLALGTLASAVAARAHCTVEIVRPAS